MGLCRTWEKNAPLASLALEGALCCLGSLKGRPSSNKDKGGGGAGVEALDGALKALATAVRGYFGKKRGSGLTASQVSVPPLCCLSSALDVVRKMHALIEVGPPSIFIFS